MLVVVTIQVFSRVASWVVRTLELKPGQADELVLCLSFLFFYFKELSTREFWVVKSFRKLPQKLQCVSFRMVVGARRGAEIYTRRSCCLRWFELSEVWKSLSLLHFPRHQR